MADDQLKNTAPNEGDTTPEGTTPEGDVNPLGPGLDAEPEEERAVTYAEVMQDYVQTDALPLRGEGTDAAPWTPAIVDEAARVAVNFLYDGAASAVVLVVSESRDRLVDFWNALAKSVDNLKAKYPQMRLAYGSTIVDDNILDLRADGVRRPSGLFTAYVGEDQSDETVLTWADEADVDRLLYVVLDDVDDEVADVLDGLTEPPRSKVFRTFTD